MTRRRQFVNAVAVSLLTAPAALRSLAPGRLHRQPAINLKTAKALGLALSPSLLLRGEVIE